MSPRAIALAEAIRYVETGGNFNARGKSGEGGAFQYMAGTWRAHSMAVYGEFREKTPQREWLVAVTMIDRWLQEGHTEAQVARMWNQGNAGPCVRGVNKYGVEYDSCAYQNKVLAMLR